MESSVVWQEERELLASLQRRMGAQPLRPANRGLSPESQRPAETCLAGAARRHPTRAVLLAGAPGSASRLLEHYLSAAEAGMRATSRLPSHHRAPLPPPSTQVAPPPPRSSAPARQAREPSRRAAEPPPPPRAAEPPQQARDAEPPPPRPQQQQPTHAPAQSHAPDRLETYERLLAECALELEEAPTPPASGAPPMAVGERRAARSAPAPREGAAAVPVAVVAEEEDDDDDEPSPAASHKLSDMRRRMGALRARSRAGGAPS